MIVGSGSRRPDESVRSTRLLAALLVSAAMLAALYAGCTLPRGGTQAQECTVDAQCDDGNPCTVNTCLSTGLCDVQQAEDGPLPNQTPGDCTLLACDRGQEVSQFDSTDWLDDDNVCTEDSCDEDTRQPVNDAQAMEGSSCLGTGRCENGECIIICTQDEDCPDDGDRCTDEYCNNLGECDESVVADGTPLDPSEQVEGDCVLTVCIGGAEQDYVDADDLPTNCNEGCQIPLCDELAINGRCQDEPRGTVCSASGGSVCNDTGVCVECNEATDCGQPAVPQCETRECVNEACVITYQSSGTPLPSALQEPGDCHELRCDGSGGFVDAVDDTDLPVDPNDCTQDVCTSGVPTNPPEPVDTACGATGNLLCDGAGHCSACNDAADCDGPDPTDPEDFCFTRYCDTTVTPHLCDPIFTGDGAVLPVADQTAGDCREVQCDGNGGIKNAVDDSDLPDDSNDCTADVCTGGSPSNPDLSGGTVCSTGVCNGSGSCEECYNALQCPLPADVCVEDYCRTSDWTCQERNVADGQPALPGHQEPGDCKTIFCDGAGNPVDPPTINDNDPPDDGNDCTLDECNNGVGSNTDLADETPCTGGASGECWDGFCCDSVCDSLCEGCSQDLTGQADGECHPIPSGDDPDNECPANERCDGAGNCDLVAGETCTSNGQCLTGNCVDGVCCQVSDCPGACNTCALSGDGTCSLEPATTVCRAGSGDMCDPDETCTGSSPNCPSDAVLPSSTVCRAGSGDMCDPDENCPGNAGDACPSDVITGSGTVCRAGSGDMCDPDETCTGTAGQACPSDTVMSGSTVCRAGSGDMCDPQETCTGTAGEACPTDDREPTSTVCRAGSGDSCDPDEHCPDTPAGACPADSFEPSSTVCRSGSGDMCDPDETCPGAAGQTCPSDTVTSSGTECRAGSGDMCDPAEECTGTAGEACPTDDREPTSTVCRSGSGDSCDPDEHCPDTAQGACPADSFEPSSTVCRAGSGDMCDPAEQCPGSAGEACPADVVQNSSYVCRTGSGDECDPDERCTGNPSEACPADVVQDSNYVCRTGSGDMCDPDEQCTGNPGETCPSDSVTAAGVECRAGSGDLCDLPEQCTGTAKEACPDDVREPTSTVCRAGSGDSCDLDEYCPDTAQGACPADVVAPSGTVCRTGSGDVCDPDETCTGTAGEACPDDVFQASDYVCRTGSGDVCDPDETCTGSAGDACPADSHLSEGDPCDDDLLWCTGNETCSSGLICTSAGDPCTPPDTCSESTDACVANVWINEIHYQNQSGDTNEGVEIAGPAGTSLSSWTVVAYDGGDGTVYATINLSGTLPDDQNGYGTAWFAFADLLDGPDGLALVDDSGLVVQFLSYEGSFTATDGAASGLTSEDIGVDEDSNPNTDVTLQLQGSGQTYSDFTWAGPIDQTRDSINTGQSF